MATLQTFSNSSFTAYVNGSVRTDQYPGVSNVSGDGNRVMRATISSSTSKRRATSVNVTFYNVYSGGGNIVCQISSGANDFVNAVGAQGSSIGRATAYVSGAGYKTATFTFVSPITLDANTTYYLWCYPNETGQGCALKVSSVWADTGAALYGDNSFIVYGSSVSGFNSTVSPAQQECLSGDTVTLTATADIPSHSYVTGYQWRRWSGSSWEDISGATSQSYSAVVSQSETYACYISYATAYAITPTSANPDLVSVSGGGYVAYGSTTTITATLIHPTGYTTTFDGWYLNGSLVSTSLSYTVTCYGDATYQARASSSVNNYYLDLNGWLDGASSGSISGFGTCDVYINGSRVAAGVSDYYTTHPYGTTYEFKNFAAANGKQYMGYSYSGALSGTIGAGNVTVYPVFATKPVISRGVLKRNQDTGYTAYVFVTDPGGSGLSGVKFPTWTDANGQDDLPSPWPDGEHGSWTVDGQTYNYRYIVLRSDHNYEWGTYITHVYAYANSGAYGVWGGSIVLLPGAARIYTNGGYQSLSPYIYHNNAWQAAIPYVYNNNSYRPAI